MIGQKAHHERRQKATKRRQRIGHAKDGARKVGRNIQTIAEVSGGDGTVDEQLRREYDHSPCVIVADKDLHNHQEAGQHNGKGGKRLARLGGGQFAGATQIVGKVRRDNGHCVLAEIGQRGEEAVLDI